MKQIKYIMTALLIVMTMTAAAQGTNVRTRHKVEKSETVFGIAKKYGITIEELINANPDMKKQGYELKYGDTINIPYAKDQSQCAQDQGQYAQHQCQCTQGQYQYAQDQYRRAQDQCGEHCQACHHRGGEKGSQGGRDAPPARQ